MTTMSIEIGRDMKRFRNSPYRAAIGDSFYLNVTRSRGDLQEGNGPLRADLAIRFTGDIGYLDMLKHSSERFDSARAFFF